MHFWVAILIVSSIGVDAEDTKPPYPGSIPCVACVKMGKFDDTSRKILENSSDLDASKVRYDGDQLWFIDSLEKENEFVIRVLRQVYGGILWRSNGKQKDIYMPKATLPLAIDFMNKIEQNYTVIVEDVQNVIDSEARKQKKVEELNWDDYHDFSVLEKFLKDIAEKYPSLTKLHTIGYTFENRPLYVMKIGNGDPNNHVMWLDGGTHAREWGSSAATSYIIDHLVKQWDKFPEHIRQREWYIMPMVNPDGYEYSRHYDRMWAKNRRVLGVENYVGVDLNSNYNFQWDDVNMELSPSHFLYRGPEPLSELETQAIANFTLSLVPKPSVFLTYHCYGQVLFYPWAYQTKLPSDFGDLRFAAEKAIKVIKQITGSDYSTMAAHEVFGPAPGGGDDWAKAILQAKYVYTVELGDVHQMGFLLPSKHLKTICQEAWSVARVMSEVLS